MRRYESNDRFVECIKNKIVNIKNKKQNSNHKIDEYNNIIILLYVDEV